MVSLKWFRVMTDCEGELVWGMGKGRVYGMGPDRTENKPACPRITGVSFPFPGGEIEQVSE